MKIWIISKERKNHQRAMSRALKSVNKCLRSDELWKGRFELRQVDARWIPYEDGSGEELYVQLMAIDHVNGTRRLSDYKSVNSWRFPGNLYEMYCFINDFIIDAHLDKTKEGSN